MLTGLSVAQATLNALSRSLAVIEFDPTGRILTANENFCRVVGYELPEIVGKHHSIFTDADYRNSAEYRDFWTNLARGQFNSSECKRIGKGGREIWLQASYNPVKNASGKITKVVKVAMDVTAERMRNAEFESKLAAISRVQATIEFSTSGEIITANENFLAALNYRLQDLVGQHHRMLCDPAYASSADYQDHWRRLNQGEFVAAEFKRLGKDGRPVWIQASYNPVFDSNGKVFKVVKFATVISDRVEAVADIAKGLSLLASNDLSYEIKGPFTPAFEQLRVDFNRSIVTLRGTMRDVTTAATNIETGAQEISTAADDLSHRTESQAANLEETAAALDQITTTVKSAASGAEQARLVVLAADEDAKGSATIVNSAVEAMGEIAQSSQKISQIIGVIDEIAFQTNLLALNAGVEAARAGEAGRGFAVVASEVRALAQRSAEAAKEIKALIHASSTQVENGVKLVGDTGASLKRIMSEVGEISVVVQTIASGAKDQANGLAEINTAVTQMDRATQQNAAMVEESTAACRLLTEEAMHLGSLVRQFRLDEAGRREESRAPSYAKSQSRAA